MIYQNLYDTIIFEFFKPFDTFILLYLRPVLFQCNDRINEKIDHFVKSLYYLTINTIVLIGDV